MSKSIDEVWRQMQAQRQAEIARQQAQERVLYEQRERARQEYLQRMRMFEFASPIPTSPAPGAGAGGGGRLPQQNNVSVSNQATLHWSFDSDNNILYYFVYNFGTSELSDIKQVTLDESPNNYPVTEGGFFLSANNNENSTIDLLFIDLNANIIWQDSTDNQSDVDIENFSRYIGAYYLKGGNWKLVLFDKDSVIKTFNFGENLIEGGGYSYNDVWSGGIVVVEEIGTIRRYWIINFSEETKTQFYEVDNDLGDYLNVYQYAYSNKILTRKNGDLWEVFSSTGDKLAEFDAISTFATVDWSDNEFTFLDDNGSFLIAGYDNTNDDRTITLFSGSTNTFSSKVIDRSVYSEYDSDVYYQKDYDSTNDWNAGGSAIFLFYDTSDEPDDIRYYSPEGLILPIWSTDTELRDFYTFSSARGINDNLDDSNIAFTRSADHICLLVDNNKAEIFYFSDEGSNYIADGGNDMYDSGNLLWADELQIIYTHTQLSDEADDSGVNPENFISDGIVVSGLSGSVFGTSSVYFTNLYPGLFVLAAQGTEVDEFRIDGELGADGDGDADNYNFGVENNSNTYQVFVKRVWGAQDPSVNHIIIVNAATASGITQSVSLDTDDDLHSISGLSINGVTEIYYLLIALVDGIKLENNKVEEIVTEFLNILNSSSDINQLLTNLNSDYSDITGVFQDPDTNYSILRFNREGEVATVIPTDINKSRVLDDDDQINGKTILQFERGLTAIGSWGWSDLSDVEDRFYYSLRYANNNQIGNYIEGQELIMKDVVNDEYWAIQFTEWGGYGDGGFAYTRQLISDGTFSGDPIYFTFSNFEQVESDVISAGVLELRRGWNGPIYNAAKEGESNSWNPSGTLWNSQWVYNLDASYQYKWYYTDGSASNPTSSTDFNALFSGIPEGSGTENDVNIDWTDGSGKPGYLPSEYFAWQVDCLLKVDDSGTYLFRTTSDDGNQLTIDGSVITEFYGSRAIGEYDTSDPINLSTGLYTFRYRLQQGEGGSGARVEWQGPEDGTFSVIPSQNLVINEPIIEYDHYIVATDGQIIGSVSTGNEYSNDYEGKTYILEDQVFNQSWISNTENSQNWTLLDKYYEENDDVNNIITEDGLRKGIFLLQNGFSYRIITEENHVATFTVPFTGNYLNKIEEGGVFHKGAFVLSEDESTSWLRFYDIGGNLIDTIEKSGQFDSFDWWVYGDRCVVNWSQDGTIRFAFFDGESVTQFDSGRNSWDTSVNDYIWWD